MKHGKRFVSLLLALVMICGLMVNAGAAEAQEEISAYLNYDITVTYNGEAQTMTDAAGNTVYPVSYNGTTYLPVRAVSNMLGVAVEWDGATQTVILSDSSDGRTVAENGGAASTASGQEEIKAYLAPGITVKYNGEVQTMTDAAGNVVYPVSYNGTTYLPVRAVSNMLGVAVDWEQDTQTVVLSNQESGDLSENHVSNDWGEIDWSTAGDGYVRVIVTKLPEGTSSYVSCRARWNNNGKVSYGTTYTFTEGEWNIPLVGGSTEYTVQANLGVLCCDHNMTEDESQAIMTWDLSLSGSFDAEITNPDNLWLLSTPSVDFAHAPNAMAKAVELTKDCTTDAEKITAIFNWVAKNIKYDYKEWDRIQSISASNRVTCWEDEVHGEHTPAVDRVARGYTDQNGLNLDTILERKTGVCAHYATLMAGMLRSLGIPCKVVKGSAQATGGKKESHVWVAVKPETGTLDMSALNAGYDYTYGIGVRPEPTDWIRLDPTWKSTGAKGADNDKNYSITEKH